jgi:hypothetical protein
MKSTDIRQTITFIAVIILAMCTLIFFREYGKHDCRFVVKMKDREPIRANIVNYYKVGVVDIVDCNGRHSVHPTSQVEKITEEP